MADPVGASLRMMIAIVLVLSSVFGVVYGTLIGIGIRNDHPGWVSAGWVGLAFTGLIVLSIVLWVLSDFCWGGCLGKLFNDGKSLLAFLLTFSTALLAGTGISIWLVVRGSANDNHGLLGGAICALVHFVLIDLIIISMTVLMVIGFVNGDRSNPGADQ